MSPQEEQPRGKFCSKPFWEWPEALWGRARWKSLSCFSAAPLGSQQHSQKNSQYLTCKLPSITRGRRTKPEAAQCIWEVINLDLITGIQRFWVKLVPWLPVLRVAQGSDQIWPYKEKICFSVVWWPNSVPPEVAHGEPTAPSTLPQNKDTDVHCRLHNNLFLVFLREKKQHYSIAHTVLGLDFL